MPRKFKKSVWGIFPSRLVLESAIDRLREGGFLSSDISVLLPENLGPKDLITEKSTKAPEGATAGAGSGVLIGGALGWLAGIGAIALPGIGPFIAAGPIMAALAGLGVGGVVGGITGALIGAGIPEYERRGMKGGSAGAAFWPRSIATNRTKLLALRPSWNVPAARILLFRAKRPRGKQGCRVAVHGAFRLSYRGRRRPDRQHNLFVFNG